MISHIKNGKSKKTRHHKTIQLTVDSGLCNGCAMCATVCPQNCIAINETPGGLLEAKINDKSCTQCGVCRKVCGGIALHREVIPSQTDPFKGNALSVFLVKAKNSDLRKNGQSGGAAIAIASMLLDLGTVNGVLSTTMPKDGSLRPFSRIVRKREELFKTQGSKYVPVPWAKAFFEFNPAQDQIAIIGIPCQFRSLSNALKTVHKTWEDSIALKIGLVCEGVLSYRVLDYIFSQALIQRDQCRDYRFKSKIPKGWPGDGRAVMLDGSAIFVPNKVRTGCKDAFRPLYCQLCFDKMNILSDIVCSDPWGINNDKKGHTVVLVRTPQGQNIFDQAVESGVLSATEITCEQFFEVQHVEARRTLWTSAIRIVQKQGGRVPDYPIDPKWYAPTVGFTTRQLHLALIERGKYLHEATDKRRVLETIPCFNKKLKGWKTKIAFLNKWGPVPLARRIVKKFFKYFS